MNTNQTLNYIESLIEEAKKAGRKMEVQVDFQMGKRKGRFEFNTNGIKDMCIKNGSWHQYEIRERLSIFIVLSGWDSILDKHNTISVDTDKIEVSKTINIINHDSLTEEA